VLGDEQVAAVRALTDAVRVAGLVGRAGTGKGVVIHAASAAFRAEGWQVVAVATQGATAQRLGGQAGVPGMTIDQMLARLERGSLAVDARTVVFVDEAGMVDTHRMAGLVRVAERTGCSLRLVGDPAQLAAIGPGGLLPSMLAVEGVPGEELHEIHRTRHQWLRDYQNLVRDGRSAEALGMLREHDAAHMLDTQGEAMQRMVDDWDAWRHQHAPGDSLLVVHTTNQDVDTVNALAQAKRLAAGELGAYAARAPDRDYDLREGDRVIFRTAPYRPDDRAERRVENGTRGTIERIDPQTRRAWVAVEESEHGPRTVQVDLERCAALRLDYASHVYPAQGDTRARTAELTGGPAVGRESAYVGASRLRERHDLYTSREALGTNGTDHDRWQRLAERMDRSRAEPPSIAYAEQPARRIATSVPDAEHDVARRWQQLERDLARAQQLHDELERSFPYRLRGEIRETKHEWTKTRDSIDWADRRIAEAERDVAKLRPWQRDRLKDARQHLENECSERDRLTVRANELANRHNELVQRPDAPAAWKREHATELTERARRVTQLTAGRDRARARSVEHHVRHPQRYVTRVIGERPPQTSEHERQV
jgi:hypothetical protein